MKPVIFLVGLFAVVFCGEPDGYSIPNYPCSIMSILSGRRRESENCNLKMILINQLQTQANPEIGNYLKEQNSKRHFLQLETCEGAGAVCRTGGRRNCICPSSFVCDPIENGLHVCVKLRYFQTEDMRR